MRFPDVELDVQHTGARLVHRKAVDPVGVHEQEGALLYIHGLALVNVVGPALRGVEDLVEGVGVLLDSQRPVEGETVGSDEFNGAHGGFPPF